MELPESATLRLARLYPGTIVKPAVRTILVPRPSSARVGGEPLRDAEIVAWVTELVEAVLGEQVAA
jgi:transcription-repair coupling factor (superfamily II helicase)